MRPVSGTRGNLRGSALWGKKTKGEARSSALWGKPGRGFAVLLGILVALAVPVAAPAASGNAVDPGGPLVPDHLLAAAQAHPARGFSVIVQAQHGKSTAAAARLVRDAVLRHPGKAKGLKKKFVAVNGVSARLTGAQVLDLAQQDGLLAITRDKRVRLAGQFMNDQDWVDAAGVSSFWTGQALSGLQPPAIAVVDSGIQRLRSDFDFGLRVVKQVSLTGLTPNSAGDGRGHGTLVAGIAAGSALKYAGSAPTAPIVSIDVMDDNGMALTSDVIAAADWILANKATYNIRVANFSLQSTQSGSFMYDPLDQAVEKLWFRGVVVVAAAGNYGVDSAPTTVAYAPGNDPFVITVGASDLNGTPLNPSDDFAAPWSAYGYTLDGFAKPELGAPGRHLIAPVPGSSTMPGEHPERLTSPGYMWMSGTSFSAPVVSGAAALLLAKNPRWTPDQVKGALMVSAQPTAAGAGLGVGQVNSRAAFDVTNPPNPNLALNQFVVSDGSTGKVFDAASWANTAQANASWNSASWNSASWAAASWNSASWAAASWAAASWNAASWAAAAWAE
jgi:serine protease AprX